MSNKSKDHQKINEAVERRGLGMAMHGGRLKDAPRKRRALSLRVKIFRMEEKFCEDGDDFQKLFASD